MTEKYKHTYNIYKYSAKRALDYYRNKADISKIIEFCKNYKDVIKTPDKLKLKDILNCFAYEAGYLNWAVLKSNIDKHISKFINLYETYNAHIESNRNKKSPFKNLLDVYKEYRDYTGFELKSEKFSNLYIGLNQHTFYDQSLLHGSMSWIQMESCEFKKCIFLRVGFETCDIKNTDFSNSIFSGIPKSIHGPAGIGSHVIYESDFSTFDAQHGFFDTCNFDSTFLTASYCRSAVFVNSSFRKAVLACSNLQDTQMINCDLRDADARHVQFSTLRNCNMSGTNLNGAHINLAQDIMVNSKTIFPSGVKMDVTEHNEKAIAQGINTGSTEQLHFVCANSHRWKAPMYRFAIAPFCPHCPKESTNTRRIDDDNEIVDILPDQPDLLDFISPIYAMRKEAAMHGFPPQL